MTEKENNEEVKQVIGNIHSDSNHVAIIAQSSMPPGKAFICYELHTPEIKDGLEGYIRGHHEALVRAGFELPAAYLVSLETITKKDS